MSEECERCENYGETLWKIQRWIDAYPLDIFPEPDFAKAHKVLTENGMTLDSISASNMRHVLSGISKIINENKVIPNPPEAKS